ncbi:ABC transporter substrate-binding protein [Candidatus Margulisiibacteriota bacterium]
MIRKIVVIFLCLLLINSVLAAGNYDGLWFLGFNLKSSSFKGPQGLILRRAINEAIDRKYLGQKIMGASFIPDSFIPLGMDGYVARENFYEYDPEQAKALIKENEGLSKIKVLKLLHTDGVKTERVAKKIRSELSNLGIDLVLMPVNYADADSFEKELKAKDYDIFLMGFKTKEGQTKELVRELFSSEGKANFFGLDDPVLTRLSSTPSADQKVYNDIQDILWQKQVILPIFYIERL